MVCLLHMRPFQFWHKSRGFHPLYHSSRVVRVTRQGLHALQLWKMPVFLNRGLAPGACCHHKSLMTDASLMGQGMVLDGLSPLGLDAMAETWLGECLYAFPPVALFPGVLAMVHQDEVHLLVEAPF